MPGLRGKIIGARAHMSAQQPGQRFPRADGKRSWGVVYGGAFDYITQRPSAAGISQGDLLVGGGFMRSLKQGVDQVGLYDDGAALEPLTVAHIAGVLPAIFHPRWGAGGGLKQVWSGIIGLTGDSLPFVGRLSADLTDRDAEKQGGALDGIGQSGEWVAAGFAGEEDLPAIPGRPGGRLTEWFPHELLVSHERLRTASIGNLANHS